MSNSTISRTDRKRSTERRAETLRRKRVRQVKYGTLAAAMSR